MLLDSLIIASFIHNLESREVLLLKSIIFAKFLVFAIEANQRIDAPEALLVLTPFKDSGFNKAENSFDFLGLNLFKLCVSIYRTKN